MICGVAGCSKAVDEKTPVESEYVEYVIPKGQHYAAGNNFRVLEKKSLAFKVRFDSSCIYKLSNASNAGDINKLYGFSDCGANHQVNSARFGWVWNGSVIELYAYCYGESKRSSKLLGTVGIGREIELGLAVESGKYVFMVNGFNEYIQRSCNDDTSESYQLFPYFGGDEVAPHDVRIFIKDL
jgi:hypothetical protein